MATVYITQFEMTQAYSSARKCATGMLTTYGNQEWAIDAYGDPMHGQDLSALTVENVITLINRQSFFSLLAKGSHDEMRFKKCEVQ